MDEAAQALLAWLRRRVGSQGRKLRAAGLPTKAALALQTDSLVIRGAFRDLRAAGLISYAADTMGLPYTGFLNVTAEDVPQPEALQAWRSALEAEGVEPILADALLPSYGVFEELDEADKRLAVKGLMRVRHRPPSGAEFGFSLSAREILGSSKVLDRLTPQARRLLGIDRVASTPRYVVVAGPPKPGAVLLIENSTTFEEAVRAGLASQLTLIAAYGYGLSILSDSAGWALVESIRGGRAAVLSRTGGGHRLEDLLQHDQLLFWGDLDREGLRIAMALRQRLQKLQLSALYGPMCIMAANRATSHPYAALTAKANQLPWVQSGDALMDRLAAVCATRAVDQESVDLTRHSDLAGQPFVIANDLEQS